MNIIAGGSSTVSHVQYGVGGICSDQPAVHESLLTTTVVLVLFKLICRGFYFIFSVRHVEGTSPTLGEVANNEAAFVWMMLIVILMNKVKLNLIYVRNQQLAGFFVRQIFTCCYGVVLILYLWNCLLVINCNDS
jgi:hypothetical protein